MKYYIIAYRVHYLGEEKQPDIKLGEDILSNKLKFVDGRDPERYIGLRKHLGPLNNKYVT
jgi:hypothetical protein